MSIVRGFEGFLGPQESATATTQYYSDTDDPKFIAKSVLYVTQTVLGDSFMVRDLD